MLSNFDKMQFAEEIEQIVNTLCLSYIEAITHWCDINEREVEFAASLIKKDPVILAKIEAEAISQNAIKTKKSDAQVFI